jgi:hypothetical protein
MTALTVRLPNLAHAKIRELAARDEISVSRQAMTGISLQPAVPPVPNRGFP